MTASRAAGVFVCSILLFSRCSESILTRGPSDTMTMLGSTVVLPCYTNISTPVMWELDTFGDPYGVHWYSIYQGFPAAINYRYADRFSVSVDPAGNQYNLTILDVKFQDAGAYRCADDLGYGLGRERQGLSNQTATARLVVIGSLECSYSNNSIMLRGKFIELDRKSLDSIEVSCKVSYNGNKHPVLEWSLLSNQGSGIKESLNNYTESNITKVGFDLIYTTILRIGAERIFDKSVLIVRLASPPPESVQLDHINTEIIFISKEMHASDTTETTGSSIKTNESLTTGTIVACVVSLLLAVVIMVLLFLYRKKIYVFCLRTVSKGGIVEGGRAFVSEKISITSEEAIELLMENAKPLTNINEMKPTADSLTDGRPMKPLDDSNLQRDLMIEPEETQKLIPLNLPDVVITKRAALGQKMFVGQLYDEQEGSFLQEAIFHSFSGGEEMEVSNDISALIHLFDPKSISSKFEALNLSDRDKIDVLLDYVKPSGHSEVLLNKIQSSEAKVNGILLSIKKRIESLKHINLGTFHDRKAALTAKNIRGTHVVIGIDWGFSAALLAENLKHEEIVPDITQNDIDTLLNCISEHLSRNSYNFTTNAVSIRDIGIHLFHDQLPSQCDEPITDDEKIDLFCSFQTKVVMLNEGELLPVSYYLAKLEHIYNVADGASIDVSNLSENGIDNSLSTIVIDYLQKIQEVKAELRDTRKKVHTYEKCLAASEIQKIDKLRKDLFENEQSFKKYAKNEITDFRTRVKNTSKAVALQLSNMQTYNTNLDKLKHSCKNPMKEIEKKIAFLEELKSTKIKYFGVNATRENLINYSTGGAMVLFFDVKSLNFYTAKDAFFEKMKELCYPQNMFESDNAAQTTSSGVQFAVVDREMCPELAEIENIDSGSHICWYESDHCYHKNIEEDIIKERELNLAKTDVVHTDLDSQPLTRAVVRMSCPNASNGVCSIEKHVWLCYYCKKDLQYDVTNKTFYCGCGCAPVTSYSFRCGSGTHGGDFIQFDKRRLENELSILDPAKEITILVLGETGVGKSTWINSILNYINFETLEKARDAEVIPFLIPSTFSILDDNYVSRKISVQKKGAMQCDTEVLSDRGESATQDPKAYRFQARDFNVRLIDTPGVGDVRGVRQDDENFDKILRFLSTITELHGICILLKPNDARLTVIFRYCITELLKHLHRTAAANIMFCFTNARGTFYRPGDSLVPLRNLLKSIKMYNQGLDIQTTFETMYCLDNEAFRFLCAFRQGIHFSQDDLNNFATSWTKSRNETLRLFDYVLQLKPHSPRSTLSLNEARNIILALTKPVAEISRNILINITAVKRKKEEIKSLDLKEKDLKEKLYIPQISLLAKPMDHPTTVCTAKKCTETREIKGASESRVHYKTVCHCPCSCGSQSGMLEVISDPGLRQCSAMRNGVCTVCGCTWDCHMHIKYTLQEVIKNVLDTHTQDLIKTGASIKEILESFVREMEDRIDDLQKSKQQITEITAKFGSFLKFNAIVPYNDGYEAYLQLKIREEKDIASVSKSDVTVKSLEQYLAMYKEKVEFLNQQMNMSERYIILTPEDILKLRDELFSLKSKGEELQKVTEVVLSTSLLSCSQPNSVYYETITANSLYAAYKVQKRYRRLVSGNKSH